jgi:hypothetical protein
VVGRVAAPAAVAPLESSWAVVKAGECGRLGSEREKGEAVVGSPAVHAGGGQGNTEITGRWRRAGADVEFE